MFDVFYIGLKPNLFAHELSCSSIEDATNQSMTKFFWVVDGANDYSEFNFDWKPDRWEEDYLQVFPSQWQRSSGTYFAKKETADKRQYYFRHAAASWGKVVRKPSLEHWDIPNDIIHISIDRSWHPDPMDPPYIYKFASRYQRWSGVLYIVPGAINYKYVRPFDVEHERSKTNWIIPDSIEHHSIDFSWRPDMDNTPFNYHFASKYNRSSGVIYRTSGATNNKFIDPFEIEFKEDKNNWIIPVDVDSSSIDFTWRPDALETPFNYHFPSVYQQSSGVIYSVIGATTRKDVSPFKVVFHETRKHWTIPNDLTDVDLSWRPDSTSPPYNYKFPSKWVRESGLEYKVPGATQDKFVNDLRISFKDTIPKYFIETTIEDLVTQHINERFWALNKEMKYDEFDFGWRPDASQLDYNHVFGSKWQKHSQTFFIGHGSGFSESSLNFVSGPTVQADGSIDIFYIDKFNDSSNKGYEDLKARFKNVIKVRYVKSIYDTTRRCIKHNAKTQAARAVWVVSSENDYSNFDFDWRPEPWQSYMFHIFGSQWQTWSDTYFINVDTFEDHDRWCKDLKDMPDLHFVKKQKVKALNIHDIYMIDFGNQHDIRESAQHNKLKIVRKSTRFTDSYLTVLKRIITTTDSEYIWVISSVCDYSNFNFEWHPEPFRRTNTHIFKSCSDVSSNGNDFGDTFYIHVHTAKKSIGQIASLEELNGIHYCDDQIVPRYPLDKIPYTGDDLTSIVKQHKFNMPYAIFYPENTDISTLDCTPTLWTRKQRLIHVFTESGSIIIPPRDSLQYLGVQCYDYPYIMRHTGHFLPETALNIVFISNGEVQAEQWYNHLISITEHDPTLTVKRVKNIKGRANAYKAAANASDTDWFFTVFGKIEVIPDFDWHWQPDRLQEPKHYIFNAYNPVTKLEYGHMGMIAYNKKLVLETNDWGLDFTLSRAHEVVPLLSGIAHYNTDPKATWRTAFREVIKLIQQQDEDSFIRLNSWLTSSGGENGEWSMKGANDAKEYALKYKDSSDYTDRMMKSFEWEWLDNLFHELYT